MIRGLFQLLRVHHWIKNAFCLAGLFFSGRFTHLWSVGQAVLVFFAFSFASSAVYVLNDLVDIERDAQHPKKRNRPLPRGIVGVKAAQIWSAVLALLALLLGAVTGLECLICLCTYFLINGLYSSRLKHVALLDTSCIALGFVLRLLAGIYAINEMPTAWAMLCTLFLAYFLGFSKRRSELADLNGAAEAERRPVLANYSLPLLDSVVSGAAVMTVMSYALFTATSGRNPSLVVTVPIVYLAVLRYELILVAKGGTEEPERLVLKDPVILGCIFLWLVSYAIILFGDVHVFR